MTETTMPTMTTATKTTTTATTIAASAQNLQSYSTEPDLITTEPNKHSTGINNLELSTDYKIIEGSSPELRRTPAEEMKYCRECESYEDCQFKGSGRGFEPMISTYIFNNQVTEYKGYRKCRHKLEEEERLRTEELLKKSGLPSRKKRLKEVESRQAAKVLAGRFILGETRQVAIIGDRSKEIGIATGHMLIERGNRVLYKSGAELLTGLRYQENEEYGKNLQEIIEIEVLIIHLGGERRTPYNEEQMNMIIEMRARRDKRTMVTSVEEAPYAEVAEMATEAT